MSGRLPAARGARHRVLVIPYRPAERLAALERIAPAAVLERWRSVDRSGHDPRIVAVLGHAAHDACAHDDGDCGDGDCGDWIGAALVTARPRTAYVKIVDVVGDAPAVVPEVVAHARGAGAVQVKWEGWTAGTAPASAGFTALTPPAGDESPLPAAGHVRWLDDVEVPEPPFYRQSTHFTCGAVAALIAQAHAGVAGTVDRSAELTLWRDATNFLACEPVGLAVAVRRRWPAARVTVSLDTTEPVLVDSYAEQERGWRAVLQHASRQEAGVLGVPVDGRRISIPDVRAALAAGEQVLLLITLGAMLGVDAPHWVLCHGAVPGAVLVEDSWVGESAGETWVDAHLLPVHDDALDEMALIEGGRHRGAVRIANPAPGAHSLGTGAPARRGPRDA